MSKNENSLDLIVASDLYSKYSDLLSLTKNSLLLVDLDGKIIQELIPAPNFCRYICQKEESFVCEDYKKHIEDGENGCFICKRGLNNVLMPIKKKEEIVAYITGLQAYSKDTEGERSNGLLSLLAEKKKLSFETVAKMHSELLVVENEKCEVHKQLCSYLSKNISRELEKSEEENTEHRLEQSIEREILKKKINDLEAKNNSLTVNPHFLFNTLNCIARMAYFEHASKTEELIYCLSDLLRYNLQKGESLHTIGTELDNIEKYLYIQKARLRERLEYEIDVPEHIKTCRVPNMILQPIVENAILHGISRKRDGGFIKIYGESDHQKIIIFVADNGNGFPKDVLKKLQSKEKVVGELGFRITDNRIKQYFGDEYGLNIVKSDFSGSTVSITIPSKFMMR